MENQPAIRPTHFGNGACTTAAFVRDKQDQDRAQVQTSPIECCSLLAFKLMPIIHIFIRRHDVSCVATENKPLAQERQALGVHSGLACVDKQLSASFNMCHQRCRMAKSRFWSPLRCGQSCLGSVG